jgi:hypothetical protein
MRPNSVVKMVVIFVRVGTFGHLPARKGSSVRFRTALLLPGLVTVALTAAALPAAATPVVVLEQDHVDAVDVHYEDGR